MDPTEVLPEEVPELLEACVRVELLCWLREAQPCAAARTVVMQRVGKLPDACVDAALSETLDDLYASMVDGLSERTRAKVMKLAQSDAYVVLKATALFAPFWRRSPDIMCSLLADLAADSMQLACNMSRARAATAGR